MLKEEYVRNFVSTLEATDSGYPKNSDMVEVVFKSPIYNALVFLDFTPEHFNKYFSDSDHLRLVGREESPKVIKIFNTYLTKSFTNRFADPLSFSDIIVKKIMESEEHQRVLEESEHETKEKRITITLIPEDFQLYCFENSDRPKKLIT